MACDVQKVKWGDIMVLPGLFNKPQENKFQKHTFRDIFSSFVLLIWQNFCVPVNRRYVRLMKDCPWLTPKWADADMWHQFNKEHFHPVSAIYY